MGCRLITPDLFDLVDGISEISYSVHCTMIRTKLETPDGGMPRPGYGTHLVRAPLNRK